MRRAGYKSIATATILNANTDDGKQTCVNASTHTDTKTRRHRNTRPKYIYHRRKNTLFGFGLAPDGWNLSDPPSSGQSAPLCISTSEIFFCDSKVFGLKPGIMYFQFHVFKIILPAEMARPIHAHVGHNLGHMDPDMAPSMNPYGHIF